MFVPRDKALLALFVVQISPLAFTKAPNTNGGERNRHQQNLTMVASDEANLHPTNLSRGRGAESRLRLYLVRHGESEANHRGIFAGQLDSPLTKGGASDARMLGESSVLLPTSSGARSQTKGQKEGSERTCPFDCVYSSDLSRAHDTCKLMLEGMHKRQLDGRNSYNNVNEDQETTAPGKVSGLCDIRLDERLRERSYGTLQGMPWNSDRSETNKIWRERGDSDTMPKWESDDDIWIRVKSFLSELVEEELLSQSDKSIQQPDRLDVVETTVTIGNDEYMSGDSCREDTASDIVNNNPKRILITSHGGVLRQILLRLVGVSKLKEMGATFDAKRKNKLITPNTSLTILDFSIRSDEHDATAENRCAIDGECLKEDHDSEGFRGVQIEIKVFANTDHLNGDVRIHDD
ncbi:unnamed protein product [Pseudo-nitzschia multistriata]|uniref:Phosphoglycerate mutase n=1 Tax=Pseudo-nitzschia multistriata TaxID=183589 RepID=A0A448Z0T7_9STRA|nr:unnamed protein product [Pseudo-nitzschia multistriata]